MPIRVKKAKLNSVIKTLEALDGKHVKAGILQEEGSQVWQSGNSTPITLAGIGYINEFGLTYTHTGGNTYTAPKRGEGFWRHIAPNTEIDIPKRSFIRVPLIQKRKEIRQSIGEAISSILAGKSIEYNLGKVGKVMAQTMRFAITNGTYKPLGEWAKKRKGSSRPLISLQNYIKHRVED